MQEQQPFSVCQLGTGVHLARPTGGGSKQFYVTVLSDYIQGFIRAAPINDNDFKLAGLSKDMLQGGGQGTFFIQYGNDD